MELHSHTSQQVDASHLTAIEKVTGSSILEQASSWMSGFTSARRASSQDVAGATGKSDADEMDFAKLAQLLEQELREFPLEDVPE